ncbi:MAG: FliM/FliN family flagellar motor switch protein [Tissierellia bacterium]|nr:FliM/FliN family flagellar motor switch protein [Tissierellia bacterium]
MAIKERILKTIVPLVAELGTATIKVKDILNLHPGDVIKLNGSQNIRVRVGSNIKFRGEVGVSNNRMAVKITEVVKEGEINDGQ